MKTDAYNIRQMITVFGYNYWNSTACKLQVYYGERESERERERERERDFNFYVCEKVEYFN